MNSRVCKREVIFWKKSELFDFEDLLSTVLSLLLLILSLSLYMCVYLEEVLVDSWAFIEVAFALGH